MSKTVLICHPMETEQDIKQLISICRGIMCKSFYKNIVPVVPTLLYASVVGPSSTNIMLNRILNDLYYERKMVDELWLYGHRLTDDMLAAVVWVEPYEIPVLYKNPSLVNEYNKRIQEINSKWRL